MLYNLTKTAIYLNQATTLINKSNGKLTYLTGDNSVTLQNFNSNSQTQETQCMAVGSALWIANNDDGDTDTQFELVNKLGIKQREALFRHVDKNGNLVLKTHSGQYNYQGMTAQEQVLHKMIDRKGGRLKPPTFVTLGTPVTNLTYNISTSQSKPATSGIVFIKGAYAGKSGDVSAKMHAEQKLLAALSKVFKDTGIRRAAVAGCKMPCCTCETVLKSTRKKISELDFHFWFEFENGQFVTDSRIDVKLNQVNATGVRGLDVDAYFKED